MREEDIRINRAIGKYGQELVPNPARILTHCNAGGLATAGYGTAVGVIRAAAEAGKAHQGLGGRDPPPAPRGATDGVGA